MSQAWGPIYYQWSYVLPFVNSFEPIIQNNFYIILQQYSSSDYFSVEWCYWRDANMQAVLEPGWI